MGRTSAELIDEDALTEAFAAAWDALAADAAANIFYERWMVLPARRLPQAGRFAVLAVWDDEPARLIGLLPLERGAMAGRHGPRIMRNWEQPVRALGDPLVLPGREAAFWAAALALLDRAGAGAYLRLSGLTADNASTRALLALLDERKRTVAVTRRVRRAVLHGGTMDGAAYRAAHIRKKVLKEQRRLLNRLGEQGRLTFDRLAAAADAAPWIDALFALEMRGWKGRDGVAAAADPAHEACYRAILTDAHALGRLDFRRLALDGTALAMLATIEAPHGHAFQLKIAYDEAFAAFSPGVLLEMAYLDATLDEGRLRQVDSCARAGHPMIDRIWIDRLEIVSLTLPFDRPLSRLLHGGQRLVRYGAEQARSVKRRLLGRGDRSESEAEQDNGD